MYRFSLRDMTPGTGQMGKMEKYSNLSSSKEAIHSGHFMVSEFEDIEVPDEDNVSVPILEAEDRTEVVVAKNAFDFESACKETNNTYTFGPRSCKSISIDATLTKLFQCMTIAYSGNKLTSPRWKNFKGLKLRWKDKIRLNNVIWRAWHMQFIKWQSPVVCQFASPIDGDTHCKPEAVVLEGKYWKRRLDTVCAEYKKWRLFYKEKICQVNKALSEPDLDFDLFSWGPRSNQSFLSPSSMIIDDDPFNDFNDTLFSCLIPNQPFAFPNPREIARAGIADFIQPGLVQLQPNLEDFVDTLDLFSYRLPALEEQPEDNPFQDFFNLPVSQSNRLGFYSQPQANRDTMQFQGSKNYGPSQTITSFEENEYPLMDTNVMTSMLDVASQTPPPPPPLPQPTVSEKLSPTKVDTTLGCDRQLSLDSTQLDLQLDPRNQQNLRLDSINQSNLRLDSINRQNLQLDPSGQSNLQLDPRNQSQLQLDSAGQSNLQLDPRNQSNLQLDPRNQSTLQLDMRNQSNLQLDPRNQTTVMGRPAMTNQDCLPQTSTTAVAVTTYSSPQRGGISANSQTTRGRSKSLANAAQKYVSILPAPQTTSNATLAPTRLQTTSPNSAQLRSSVPTSTALLVATPAVSPFAEPATTKQDVFIMPKGTVRTRSRSASGPQISVNNPVVTTSLTLTSGNALRVTNNPIAPQNALLAQLLTSGTYVRASEKSSETPPATTNLSIISTVANPPSAVVLSPVQLSQNNSVSPPLFTINSVDSSTSFTSTLSACKTAAFSTNELIRAAPTKPFRPKSDSERVQYREHRRVCHINAEQKRRCNIKTGFDLLNTLVPSLMQNPPNKLSKAVVLQKAGEYIVQLRTERAQLQDEADLLRKQIESLNHAINVCQAQLPATGAPVSRQRISKLRDMFDEYVRKRTLQNWKFWIFSILIQPLLESYNNSVSTASVTDLSRSVLTWMEQHCSLVALRPGVLNSLRHLSTSTNILSDPTHIAEEATQAVSKSMQCGR